MEGNDGLRAVYTAAIFLGAFLLFSVQPMFAKMVLPLLGGTPAVWNTCAVFFQTVLLLGYVYAHLSTQWLGVCRQALLHLCVLILGLSALPIALPADWAPPTDSNPTIALIWLLTRCVGLPFFLVSATGPLLQKWFSETGHRSARDPYFLFAASNLGSMLALAAFPFVVEPLATSQQQTLAWTAGYALLAIAIGACAVCLWKSSSARIEAGSTSQSQTTTDEKIDWRRRLRWIVLAFVPSSLTIGATTYITTDVASLPLFWVAPLAIYLLSFILAFARRPWWPQRLSIALSPVVVLAFAGLESWYNDKSLTVIGLHLTNLFLASMICHSQLAADRPSTKNLTEYYLLMSLGGNLGGIFNAIVAPLIFNTIVEYPLAIVAACSLRPAWKTLKMTKLRTLDVALPVVLAIAVVAIAYFSTPLPEITDEQLPLRLALFAMPLLACVLSIARPTRFALLVAVLLLARPMKQRFDHSQLCVERNFFGVLKVDIEPAGQFKRLLHGTTVHGMQQVDPAMACRHSTYYHPTGPLGQIFLACGSALDAPHIAVIGLGTGALGNYRKPGQDFTFFEIDPAVVRIAENPAYFTYLSECCAKDGSQDGYKIVLGDGRLKLSEFPDGHFGIIVLDAFSSDSVPTHLLTKEALKLYLRKLSPGGVIAFHVSTRLLQLPPVVARVARDCGVQAYLLEDYNIEPTPSDNPAVVRLKEEALADAKAASVVVAVVRNPEDMKLLSQYPLWKNVTHAFPGVAWTDEFSNILETIQWK